jgi:carbon storage regulator
VSRDQDQLGNAKEAEMLVLSRKSSQQIVIGSEISITVIKIEGGQVRLGIQAPSDVKILREELDVIPDESRDRPGSRTRRLRVVPV